MIRKVASAQFVIIFALIAALALAPKPGIAGLFSKDYVKEANELIKISRLKEAHEKLEAAVLDNPGDPKTHYEVGLAYSRMGWSNYADASFDNVRRTGPSEYDKKVGLLYQNLAIVYVKDGKIDQAVRKYQQSFLFGVGEKKATVEELLIYGKDYADRNLFGDAYNSFKVAYLLDNSVGGRISDIYYETCNQRADPCFNFYRRAHEFSTKHDEEIVQMLYGLYKADGMSEPQKVGLKEEINFYVSDTVMEKLFPPPPPDFKIYSPGTYTFSLKAGEVTDHWIMFPDEGEDSHYTLVSKDYKYKVQFDDGTLFNCWEISRFPTRTRTKFKIIAVTDQQVVMTVKK